MSVNESKHKQLDIDNTNARVPIHYTDSHLDIDIGLYKDPVIR